MSGRFPGGVHPPDHKELSARAPLLDLPMPEKLFVVVTQNLGAPARAVVKKNDLVKRGQVLAEAGGHVSAPVHAPTSGKVLEVGPHPHPAFGKAPAITLAPDGEDAWAEGLPAPPPSQLTPETLRATIAAAGIVGLGGAAFPTHVKLAPPPDKPIDLLIINGAECEPYITSDQKLMETAPDEVVAGARLLLSALGVARCIVGIEDNKPEAIAALRAAAAAQGDAIRVESLPVRYPQGGEKQLIYALTGRETPPPPGLPSDVGIVVQNVATAYAVKRAVLDGEPLTERIVTVTGEGIARPGNFRVRIGTPFSALIEAAGGFAGPPQRIISGGPMMGQAVFDLQIPVTKGTSCVLVFPHAEDGRRPHELPCVRCGRCVAVCPQGLVPNMMAAGAERGLWELAEEYGAPACMECGCCTYICPAGRPIVQMVRTAKLMLRRQAAEAKRV